MGRHDGQRKKRTQTRVPRLGYYLIITEGQKTEKHFFDGLRDSLPKSVQDNITIKTITTDTKSLIYRVRDIQATSAEFRLTWVVFDKDENKNFDSLIKQIEDLDAYVGWSNPCFEIWLNAYFGEMPNYRNSTSCCVGFAKTFKTKTGKDYKKNDSEIYEILKENGDEENAISVAELKLKEAQGKSNKPSEMRPATTVYKLVQEIREKNCK